MFKMMRTYTSKDVDMLVAASTIIESAIAHKHFLISKRSSWADPYFSNLKNRIDTSIHQYLGVDSARQVRESTQLVLGLQKQALEKLSEVKVQISEDFKRYKARRDEVLNQLGLISYLPAARKGDQEALINLLYQFKLSLTPSLMAEIINKGTDAVLLNQVASYATILKEGNVQQENKKGNRKEITAATITEFNDLYETVISICKIASKFFKDEPHIKDQFNFSKIKKAINNHAQSAPKSGPATP